MNLLIISNNTKVDGIYACMYIKQFGYFQNAKRESNSAFVSYFVAALELIKILNIKE